MIIWSAARPGLRPHRGDEHETLDLGARCGLRELADGFGIDAACRDRPAARPAQCAMPARCTTWLTPSSRGDQSAGVRQVRHRHPLDAVHRRDRRWIARGRPDLQAALWPARRTRDSPMKPEAPVTSTGPFTCGPLASAWSVSPSPPRRARAQRRSIAGECASTAAIASTASSSPSRKIRVVTCGTLKPFGDRALIEMASGAPRDRLLVDQRGGAA